MNTPASGSWDTQRITVSPGTFVSTAGNSTVPSGTFFSTVAQESRTIGSGLLKRVFIDGIQSSLTLPSPSSGGQASFHVTMMTKANDGSLHNFTMGQYSVSSSKTGNTYYMESCVDSLPGGAPCLLVQSDSDPDAHYAYSMSLFRNESNPGNPWLYCPLFGANRTDQFHPNFQRNFYFPFIKDGPVVAYIPTGCYPLDLPATITSLEILETRTFIRGNGKVTYDSIGICGANTDLSLVMWHENQLKPLGENTHLYFVDWNRAVRLWATCLPWPLRRPTAKTSPPALHWARTWPICWTSSLTLATAMTFPTLVRSSMLWALPLMTTPLATMI